jgi:hypothetical protein
MSTKDGAAYPAPKKPETKPTKTPKTPVVVEVEDNASDS